MAAYDFEKTYALSEGIELAKKALKVNFDASVDLSINLGIDDKNPLQAIRTTAVLPHGTGKKVRILVLCPADQEAEAKEAGADYVGSKDYSKKIEGGWSAFDVIVAHPAMMGTVGKLGKILGPRGLMPTIKLGTITQNIAHKVKEIRVGETTLKTDKAIVQTTIGRASFPVEKLVENAQEVISAIRANKHTSVKGNLIKKITCSTTMGPGINISLTSI